MRAKQQGMEQPGPQGLQVGRVQGMVAPRQKMALEHKQAHGGLVYLLSSVDFQLGNSQQKVSNRRKGC